MNKTWKKINSRQVYKNPRFILYEDDVIQPDGSKSKYYYRKSNPGVAIIPFDGNKFYLVNQYRYAIGKRLWELPIGKAENSNYLQQAKKELKEETGLTAKKWQYLGEFFPTPGSGNLCGKIFLAQKLTTGEHQREPGESDMIMKSFTIREIDQMIARGKIVDGWTITALYLFKLKGKFLKK